MRRIKLINVRKHSLTVIGFIFLSCFINVEAQQVFEKRISTLGTSYLESKDELRDYILDTGDKIQIRFKNTPRGLGKEGLQEKKSSNDISYLEQRSNLNQYILDTGDRLEIQFIGIPEFSGSYLIDKNGEIFFNTIENIKEVYVRGLTINELKKLLTERFKEILISPEINIKISEFKFLPNIREISTKSESFELELPIRSNDDYTGIFTIDEEGEIQLPEIPTDPDEISRKTYVRGLTKYELERLLEKRYSQYLLYPRIFIEHIAYKPIRVMVRGEVRSPGFIKFPAYFTKKASDESDLSQEETTNTLAKKYLLETQKAQGILKEPQNNILINSEENKNNEYITTLSNAIRGVGGLTSYSDISKIEIIRDVPIGKGGGKKRALIDFQSYIDKADSTNDIRLFDGDSIFIPSLAKQDKSIVPNSVLVGVTPKFIEVTVTGKIETPGKVKIPIEGTLSDVMNLSGPRKPLSGRVFLIRYNKDGTLLREDIKYSGKAPAGSNQNPYLIANDLINVKNSILGRTSGTLKAVTEPFIGIYAVKELIQNFGL